MERAGGELPDPIWVLGTQAEMKGAGKSRVEMRISHWGDSVSVSCSVSLECLQKGDHIDAAGQHAFNEATRLVNGAVSRFDATMPMLPTGV